MTDVGGAYALRRWLPLIAPAPGRDAPVHLQHAIHLASGDLGEHRLPWSSIMYPANVRYNACRSFGLDPDFGACAAEFDAAPLRTLQSDLDRLDELPPSRIAAVIATLNCLSEQRLLPDIIERLPDGHTDRDGGMMWYQATRGLRQLGGYDEFVEDRLVRVGLESTPDVGLNSLIQLTSTYLRVARDADRARWSLEGAEKALASLGSDTPFLNALLESRFHRVRALLQIRVGEPGPALSTMADCVRAADVATTLSAEMSSYSGLLAAENYKIVCESQMKLAGILRDADDLYHWATELIRVDPLDVMTWRHVGESLILIGATAAAGRVTLLFAAMGGHGIERLTGRLRETTAAVVSTPPSFDETLDRAALALLP
ncbi:hypothetical protein ABGB14_09430 [Nonomuraea sp. B10E15]|uniref:hypothetical protein n=1 Tax=Nonomuraea sp. B10E15 TaxID=3153560 RepID=UPI00325F5CEE